MKGLLVILSLVLGSAAFANQCPDLRGEYICIEQDEDGNEYEDRMTITQATKAGITTYRSVDSSGEVSEIVADNIEREEKQVEEGFYLVSRQRVFCEKNTLRMFSGFLAAMDEKMTTVFAKIDAKTGVSLHAGELIMSGQTTTWQKNPETGEETVEENKFRETCRRL